MCHLSSDYLLTIYILYKLTGVRDFYLFNPFQTAYGEDFLKKMGIPPDSSARNSILDHVKHVLSYTIQFLLWYTF